MNSRFKGRVVDLHQTIDKDGNVYFNDKEERKISDLIIDINNEEETNKFLTEYREQFLRGWQTLSNVYLLKNIKLNKILYCSRDDERVKFFKYWSSTNNVENEEDKYFDFEITKYPVKDLHLIEIKKINLEKFILSFRMEYWVDCIFDGKNTLDIELIYIKFLSGYYENINTDDLKLFPKPKIHIVRRRKKRDPFKGINYDINFK